MGATPYLSTLSNIDLTLQRSNTLAPGTHWEMRPVKARLTILDASWYLVHTSLQGIANHINYVRINSI